MFRLIITVLLGSSAVGCSASRNAGTEAVAGATAPTQRPPDHALDGIVVHDRTDPLTRLDAYGPEELFHHAREMTRQERLADAITLYERLTTHFVESGFVEPSQFNLGLLYERQERFKDAADAYYAVTSEPLPAGEQRRRTWLDAHFRLAVCFGKLGGWWRAVATFDKVLEQSWLDDSDRLEALLGRGIGLVEAGERESADVALSAVLRFARDVERRGPLVENGMVAEAAFLMGEIAAERYREVRLEFPVELMAERLEQKCSHLLAAQHRYIRAIRHGDAHTVAAAGFRIGHLYESLHAKILALEIPPALTTDQMEIYHQEVKKRVHILVVKALKIYEQALSVGLAAQTAADWNQRLERAIERLKGIYLAEPEVALHP